MEDERFLTEQIITYIGNKRALLGFIGDAVSVVRGELRRDKLDIADIFSGSGVVARFFKRFARNLFTNDLEGYSLTLNSCYLTNKEDADLPTLRKLYGGLKARLADGGDGGDGGADGLKAGFIAESYAPRDSGDIKRGERVFYTARNAKYIDTCRQIIAEFPEKLQKFFIAPLLTEASVKNNTGGVFKGFYKNKTTGVGQFGGSGENALSRIKADIEIPFPIFSDFSCAAAHYRRDANALVSELPAVDLIYLDPPYNQHPYGSNYFMLNLINDYVKPESVSKVSGIAAGWNRSKFNDKKQSFTAFGQLCRDARARYLLISFNSEGFITEREMCALLSGIGNVTVMEKAYNAFRASRNLSGRNTHVKEYLFLVKKR